MSTKKIIADIDEQALLNSIAEKHLGSNFLYDSNAQNKQSRPNEETVQTTVLDAISTSEQSTQSETKRTGSKQRKASLSEFRQQFMQTPKIENRKPVFVSETVRNDLDRIVRLFGERGLSVSGLVENLALHFLETYKDDVEQWRKM
ncbi:MAG: DUF3408 domain-containing protein [Bacteroidales bacterium]|jgi:hypothetical protein|nr:DUF3408 domain-containing protein [Bacteroidales bacterium]